MSFRSSVAVLLVLLVAPLPGLAAADVPEARGTVSAEKRLYTQAEALVEGVVVTYHVEDASGQPRAGAEVRVRILRQLTLLGYTDNATHVGVTDAAGDFVFEAGIGQEILVPGRYFLFAQTDGAPSARSDGHYTIAAT